MAIAHRLALALPALLLTGVAPAAPSPQVQPKTETICGWLSNPTPGNWWLTDRGGEWTIATQGGTSAPGWDDIVYDPSAHEYVKTNGEYGYGCACARMQLDRRKREVRRISGMSARPLAACRNDKRLKRP